MVGRKVGAQFCVVVRLWHSGRQTLRAHSIPKVKVRVRQTKEQERITLNVVQVHLNHHWMQKTWAQRILIVLISLAYSCAYMCIIYVVDADVGNDRRALRCCCWSGAKALQMNIRVMHTAKQRAIKSFGSGMIVCCSLVLFVCMCVFVGVYVAMLLYLTIQLQIWVTHCVCVCESLSLSHRYIHLIAKTQIHKHTGRSTACVCVCMCARRVEKEISFSLIGNEFSGDARSLSLYVSRYVDVCVC